MVLDALILGGGIAGLWTLRTLVDAGYDAALIETRALGAGQTIASQGILHAGTKYALSGHAAEASRAVAEAAAIWDACLRGGAARGAQPLPDLSRAGVLSARTHLFTAPGLASRLGALAASKALAIGPRRLARGEFPAAFADAPHSVDVYELDEPVLDGPSLLRALAAPVRDRLILAEEITVHPGAVPRITLASDGRAIDLSARALVLTAGSGNERLLAQLGLGAEVRMQRRPLHMVLGRGELPPLFAHCVTLSDKPLVTVSSASDAVGRSVWYIGGQIAESGVERTREDQIVAAKAELAHIVPWIDQARTEWGTLRVDRAEGFDAGGRRPDTPIVRRCGAVIACWPTKLVLAPLAAARILESLGRIAPSRASNGVIDAARPEIAAPPWDLGDLLWS